MKFRTLPIVAVLFIAVSMVVQFAISFTLEKGHVRELVEYKMQLAQKDFFYVLLGFHNAADEMRKVALAQRDNEDELLKATREALDRYPYIANMFVKFEPGVYQGKESNYFPRTYRSHGRIITTAHGSDSLNYYVRDWYTGALRCDSNGYWSEPYIGASTQTLIASHSIKIEDAEGRLIGVVGDDFTIEWVKDILRDIKPHEEAVCILHGTNGSIIASSDNSTPENEMQYRTDTWRWRVYTQTMYPINMQLMIAVPNHIIWQSIKWRSLITLLVLIIGIVVLVLLFRRIELNQKAYLQVENEHKLIQNEMNIARNIQRGILVHDFIDDAQLSLHATLVPMQSVGGDLYDFYRDGDYVTFIIGDVSGKGMPAAMFMSATVTLFRAAVKRHLSTNAIMEEINSTLSTNNSLMMFVTAFVGRLHLPTGRLTYCNAGHLPPLIVRDGQCRWFEMREANVILGLDSTYHFTEQSATLEHGEQIIVFTDGVTEAENSRHELLGFDLLLERLQAALQPIDDQTVYDVVCRFSADAEQSDEYIVLTCHYDHLGAMGEDVYFPGAHDNASGCAFVLNMAQYFAQHPCKNSVVFLFFAGEESGLLGSKYFTENPLIPMENIKYVINFDLLGGGDEGIMLVNSTEGKGLELYKRLMGINEGEQLLPKIAQRSNAANSDHYFFTQKKVPAIFMYTMGGKVGGYHDPSDTNDNCSLTMFDNIFKLFRILIEKEE